MKEHTIRKKLCRKCKQNWDKNIGVKGKAIEVCLKCYRKVTPDSGKTVTFMWGKR